MRTRMKRLALLLPLLVLGALGLVACGGDDDDQSGAASETDTTTATARPDTTTEAKLSREQEQELKAKLSREQVQELKRDANTEAKLSREQVQELKRDANTWARLFSHEHGICTRYVGQPMCQRLDCIRPEMYPNKIENCTPVSAAFQKSFADATVEDIKSERILRVGWTDRPLYEAAVKFSNGEVVVFNGTGKDSCAGAGSGCTWNIAEADHNRRFLAAATPRE
jgi:regulator of replication initiation timing